MIRDQPENVPWFSIDIEADRELAGGKINDEVRVPIRWEDMEKEINVTQNCSVQDCNKTAL